jgi:alkylhydroperoxidase family enzyme
MARITPAHTINPAALKTGDVGTRLELQASATFAHRSQSLKALGAPFQTFGEEGNGTLSPRLLELVRIRISFWSQCRSCMSQRLRPDLVDEGLVCSLERPDNAPDLSPAEKAAIHFADLLATDHLAINWQDPLGSVRVL